MATQRQKLTLTDDTPLMLIGNEGNMDTEGIIIVKPRKPSPFKNEQLVFSGFKGRGIWNAGARDQNIKNKKYWFGIKIADYEDGTPKFKKITIFDGRIYYLNNYADALEWHIVRHHFAVEGSPNASQVRWIVESEKKTANKAFERGQSFVKVFEYINSMSDANIKDFGRLFNLDPYNNTAEVIRGQLVQRALENPNVFKVYMDDAQKTALYQIFKRAESTNMIKFTVDRGYIFNDSIPIGVTESIAMAYLAQNRDLLMTLDIESKNIDESLSEDEKKELTFGLKDTKTPKSKVPNIPVLPPVNKDDLDDDSDLTNGF